MAPVGNQALRLALAIQVGYFGTVDTHRSLASCEVD